MNEEDPQTPSPVFATTAPAKKKKIAAAFAAVALIGGLAACGNGEAEAKAKADAASIADLEGQVASLDDQVTSLEADQEIMTKRAGDAEYTVAAYEADAAAFAERQVKVKEREQKVRGREVTVAQREAAVTEVEQAIDASMLEPGTYLVPEEVTAGRYRVVHNLDGSSCYMSQDRGNDIINNLLEDVGMPVFTLIAAPGSTFTIDSDCGTVQKID